MKIYELSDERVLNVFFEKERRKALILLKSKLSLKQEDAEDIYQNACLSLYDNIISGKLTELSSSLSTYFIQICINQGYKYLRDNKKHMHGITWEELTPAGEYDSMQIEQLLGLGDGLTPEQSQTMRDIVQDLPEPCESILWSYYGDSLKMDDIAKIIGFKNSDSVKAKKSQCMNKLKDRFAKIVSEFYG